MVAYYAVLQQYRGTTVRRYYDTMVLWYHGSTALWYCTTMLPQSYGIVAARY